MKKTTKSLTVFLILLTIAVSGCLNKQQQATKAIPAQTSQQQPSGEQLVKNGEYLVTISGCHDCHSPKEMGPNGPSIIAATMLSGYPADRPVMKYNLPMLKEGFSLFNPDLTSAAGPWGISFAANLTSDQTGIGNWTEENFKRALKEGKYKGLPGSRTLLPPMPWQNFANIKDEDVSAIFAFLKSTKPVSNVVPQPVAPK
jgi:cytochrome c553